MLKIFFFISGLLFASAALSAEDNLWPGSPPDCWTESRNVHSGEVVELESTANPAIRLNHVEEPMSGERIYSPNGGYYFVAEGDRPNSILHIFNEKDQVWAVTFEESFYPLNPTWINENLLFVRVYGGRISFIDLILNVEKESVIHAQRGSDGFMAMQQFQEGCKRLGGCECIERE